MAAMRLLRCASEWDRAWRCCLSAFSGSHRDTEVSLKIGACVKQVPAKDAPLAIVDGGAWIRESDIGFETNEPDSYALEEALRLKEKHGGEVVAISMGPERAKQTIKEALAKGADRTAFTRRRQRILQARSTGVPRARLPRPSQNENFDLILTGLQSDDQGFGQTGVLMAELLGRPHATIIMAMEAVDGRLKLKRELEAGWFQWVELPLPAVITIQSGINKPRYATLKGIMAAKKKEIVTIDRGSLGIPAAQTQKIERIYIPDENQEDRVYNRIVERDCRQADRKAAARGARDLT